MTGRVGVLMAWILFLPLSWVLSTCFTLRYLAVADLLASSSWLPFACRIPRFLQLSCMSAILPSGSSTPSVLTTFPLFVTIWLHLSSLNDILMSSL
ncbi:hypothetical protein LDENG_00230910 [Lucifuga dentata]|nr:hypothetical protein LDENG_00230910 [Lucifuga dentata]